ncbi:MAG TPA: hypothetical protein VK084_10895, partial [Chitinophagaceae bacterium]|nr:hypothetical protein [Chitinophagaceae bacterium]
MRKLYFLLLFTFFCGITKATNAQIESGSLAPYSALNHTLSTLPKNYLHKVTRKTQQVKKRITRRTQKALTRLQKQEEKSYKRLSAIDSLAAHTLLTESIDSLSKLGGLLQGKALGLDHEIPGSAYIP